ncbi:uncharacterized protein TRIADDRAFT_28406 [Trichoplax adhaerens]|uniref:IPT/TIG domain-containing protein n=1 Tax=Trichoplax adhaerens TaxID=10228 RepID=B3S326_TRIAD|nr:hypothetical protein TRIADDRAFT_28406 [Trichoplax adhaerens]EDV22893.1 hypothetical protein TRIADDRAFT_28406 [Trichoplax adhaerens]|eukprot:XP_002114759.1 hypothetical protein TRIADDRAFT_28406 [Trichoplax adhaerens]
MLSLVKIHFEKQPPSNLRKSNFFHFVLSFHDCNQRLVEVEMAKFVDFIQDIRVSDNVVISNGATYKLHLRFDNGLKIEKELCIRLVDSVSKELIRYEGQEKNSELRRVLLTHEIMCSRCSEKKSCGNRNETPSDPVIVDKYFIKVFLKCNQNCLRNAGNPRESRRFQLAICASSKSLEDVLSYSDNIFVHNNSKYGRQPKKQGSNDNESPRIRALCPDEGWVTGYTSVVIIGDNFYEGLQVAFGNVYVWSELISPHAIKVQTPPMQSPGTVDVTLSFKSRQYCRNKPGKFMYSAVEPTLELRFQRLAQMMPGYTGETDRLAKVNKCASERIIFAYYLRLRALIM